MQDLAFFNFHPAEELKLSSRPLSLAALGRLECQSRSTQKAQASFTACFKTMPRWINWRRVVLSSDPRSNTVPSLWLLGLAGLLACCCTNASGMLSPYQHSVLHVNSHRWRKAVTCLMGCLFSCSHQHWCHDQSFTCIVESLAVNGSELMEIGNIVVPKKQRKSLCSRSKKSVCAEE